MKFSILLLAALLFSMLPVVAQGTGADYERAASLQKSTQNKVFKSDVRPHWFANNTRFWYRNDLPDEAREFIVINAERGTREAAFDHARVAAVLSQINGAQISANKLPVERLNFPDDKTAILLGREKSWSLDLASYEIKPFDGTLDALESLPLDNLPASRAGGAPINLTFINRTDGDVDLFWINTEGGRQQYGTLKPGEKRRQNTYEGHVWLAVQNNKTLGIFRADGDHDTAFIDDKTKPPRRSEVRRDEALSPDGKWRAFIKTHNLWLREIVSRNEVTLTTDGTPENYYETPFLWSPDSSRLVALRTQAGQEHKVHLVESSPAYQVQPKLKTIDYLKPGDRIALSKPQLFDVAQKRQIPVSDALFPNPWSVSDFHWKPDSKEFYFLYNQRGHQIMRVIGVDAASGAARAIIDEQSETFIDYAHKEYLRYLDATREIIWMSERDGWNHLYLYDAESGKVKKQLTRGDWVVRGVESVDENKRQLLVRVGGIRPEQDPYYVHYARVDFDGNLTLLTDGDGTHDVVFSPDKKYFVDKWSCVDMPPVTELRGAEDGKLICELERADWSQLLTTGWRVPERFVAKGRDGTTDIYGVIYRPANFDATKKYPIIEKIYAGPQGSFVPKAFSLNDDARELAELGFIVVQIDGMGTSNRSKKFHDVSWKNLGDGGFPDRILWLNAAAAKYPQMDLSRVGIYGGSAGGQNALRALLAHGDFYKVAVADCGCHDNRMDKIWWNELYMSWPVGPHYAEQSNVTQAHKLQGKLLLVVGELDTNVDPASTMQVADALIKAAKDFDLLVMPGVGHGAAGTPYGKRRLQDFFVRHLLSVEPRH